VAVRAEWGTKAWAVVVRVGRWSAASAVASAATTAKWGRHGGQREVDQRTCDCSWRCEWEEGGE
jgi:hypothetical protein